MYTRMFSFNDTGVTSPQFGITEGTMRKACLILSDGSVFEGFHITREDSRGNYGEQRFQTLGLYGNVLVVMMIHTPRDSADHIISIRKANKHEQKYYWQNYPN